MPDGRDIIDVVAGEPGPKSDISLFRENRDNFDPKQSFKGDLGYLGEDLINTPIKKPKNKELTREVLEEREIENKLSDSAAIPTLKAEKNLIPLKIAFEELGYSSISGLYRAIESGLFRIIGHEVFDRRALNSSRPYYLVNLDACLMRLATNPTKRRA